jgi:hypothetical protein
MGTEVAAQRRLLADAEALITWLQGLGDNAQFCRNVLHWLTKVLDGTRPQDPSNRGER